MSTVLRPFPCYCKLCVPFLPCVNNQSLSPGSSQISRTFPIRNLQSWLHSHIRQNPFGISACITSGRRLSWPLSGEYRDTQTESKHGRIATNATFVPPDQIKGNKIVIMSQVCKQTVARSSTTLEDASLKIHRCHYSYIYLLSAVRSVSIEKCRHTTIVLGAVETVVHVNQCEQVKVIAVCRRLSTSGSTLCTFHVLTPNRPLVLSGNERLTFAPYHTHYPQLEEHMEATGLQSRPNLWDNPLYIGPDQRPEFPIWDIMDPKDLYLFAIPFHMDGDTTGIVGSLPAAYQKALQDKDRQIMLWQKTVKESGLTKEQAKMFPSNGRSHISRVARTHWPQEGAGCTLVHSIHNPTKIATTFNDICRILLILTLLC
ncbi:hypothetical protein NP493_1560g00023 [Ridgeia piscesae]|uniref:TBCC domain-containing protein 1 n=1 Tax=Ridgeia piscesae TaxID=27915 RepID=A0AAD9K0E9_RIDPI|nr:hypothetical protein NP493_1560g00023 [Ridgeia piscesae]